VLEDQTACLQARLCLEGLSVGDTFGETMMGHVDDVVPRIMERSCVPGPWRYTDDTEMAVVLVCHLEEYGGVEQAVLAQQWAMSMNANRGYGEGAYHLLMKIRSGVDWRRASGSGFGGVGSFGNGAAMRVAPLGAYFSSDLSRCVREARKSAEITHSHPEGIAGAIAIAVGASLMVERQGELQPAGKDWLRAIVPHVPAGYVLETMKEAMELPPSTTTLQAAKILGNGSGVTAPDTVPFCLWIVAKFSNNFEEALWQTVSALGDRDTTCAIVAALTVLQTGQRAIPPLWLTAREPMAGLTEVGSKCEQQKLH
jgi:ADP-ribosylglycohydrolase